MDKLTRWLQPVHQVRRGLTLLQQRPVRQRRLPPPRHQRTPQAVLRRRRRLPPRIRQRKMNCPGRARASRTSSAECRLTKRFVAPFDHNRCRRQPATLRLRVRMRSQRVLRVLPRLRVPQVPRRLPLRPRASNGRGQKDVRRTLQERPYWLYRHRTAASAYVMTALESSVHDLGIGVTVAQLTLTQFV